MWYIIKAEFERQKYIWLVIACPLILSIPYLYVYGQTLLDGQSETRMLITLAKGPAIVYALVIVVLMLSQISTAVNTTSGQLTRHNHLCLPVPITHLGIQRVLYFTFPFVAASILIFFNLLIISPFPTYLTVSAQFLVLAFIFSGLGLFLLFGDLILILFSNQSGQTQVIAIFIVFMLGLALFKFLIKYIPIILKFLFHPVPILVLNFIGLSICAFTIYTYTRYRSYLSKAKV